MTLEEDSSHLFFPKILTQNRSAINNNEWNSGRINKNYNSFTEREKDISPFERTKECNAPVRNFHNYSYRSYTSPMILECAHVIAQMEKAQEAILTPSGLSSATQLILSLCSSGDLILVSEDVYARTIDIFKKVFKKFNIRTEFFNPEDENIESIIDIKKPRILFLESPTSLTFRIPLMKECVAAARKNNCISVCDNSWATPIFFNPLEIGFDISIGSLSKYCPGNRRITMGYIASANIDIAEIVHNHSSTSGFCVNHDDASHILDALKHLPIRMAFHHKSGLQVAKTLSKHPAVLRVAHPALEESGQKAKWEQYFRGASSLFSIILKHRFSLEELDKFFLGSQKTFAGTTWGSYPSMVIPFEISEQREIKSAFRIYCGFLEPEALEKDICNGLNMLQNCKEPAENRSVSSCKQEN